MKNTITIKFLEAQVERLNIITGSPVATYIKSGGQYDAQVGNYHLSGAYGGYALHRVGNQSGGISDVFRCGHVSKRELSDRISAMICGIESIKPLN